MSSNIFPHAEVYYFFIEKGIEGLFLRIYPHFTKFSWRSSKKLKFGSLLIFSPDNFETLCTAVVRERKDEKMDRSMQRYGYADISVELLDKTKSPVDMYQDLNKKNIVILESKAYFEAYFYNLQILQEIDQLPFTDIIVDLNFTNLKPPPFLTPEYQEFAKKKTLQNSLFDEAQRNAVLSCFDRSLTIIQGPPGTGKTFIGAFIFKVLLEIQKKQHIYRLGRHQPSQHPIFLVCYTNHALDQFLEKIEEFTTQIIRLGGRTRVERFKQYSLFQRCMDKKFKRGRQFYDLRKEADTYLKMHRQLSDSVFHFTHLKIIHPGHQNTYLFLGQVLDSYKALLKHKIMHVRTNRGQAAMNNFINAEVEMKKNLIYPEIFHWLGLYNFAYLERNIDQINHQEEEKKAEPEELLDINLEEEIDEYVEEIHTQDNSRFKEQIGQILGMPPPILNSRHQTLEQEINERYNHYRPRVTEEIVESVANNSIYDVYRLPMDNRWLINTWVVECEESRLKSEMNGIVQKLKEIKVKQEEIDNELNIMALESVDVVAMTTTGAAKFKNILKNVQSRIMIVEEAAEVLEAHITTALTKHTEQLILIGDHQQLRPSTTVYELAKKYHLDVSMFERLVMEKEQEGSKYPCVTLSHQRRMRPEISEIVKIIYQDLQDSKSVEGRPNVKGLGGKNIFFLDHKYKEQTDPHIQSKLNPQEAQFIMLFSKYLLQQGYQGQQITILSLYTGQLLLLKKMQRDKYSHYQGMKNIRIVTVDNFQGEENDIILLSLVRNNQEKDIGFLEVSNRVCVALSRARLGMFLFGNAKCLREASPWKSKEVQRQDRLWVQVIKKLMDRQALGPCLTLKCEMHSNQTRVSKIEDFDLVAEGGCKELCKMRMECGHSCEALCHPIHRTEEDPSGHSNVKCLKNCGRKHECDHQCKYLCYQCRERPQPCRAQVNVQLQCSHIITTECYKYKASQLECDQQCNKIIACGHQCQRKCGKSCTQIYPGQIRKGFLTPCTVEVNKRMPCGHMDNVPCGVPAQRHFENYPCNQKCKATLECEHQCPKKCKECLNKHFHGECKKKCEKSLFCSHICQATCGECPPCNQPCRISCSHSYCPKLCGQECADCIEPCGYQCQHSKCSKKCFEICDRLPCDLPCPKKLKCGHNCLGLCGEKCPDLCRECDPDNDSFQILFGNQDNPDSRFVELLDCKHSFAMEDLDYFMEMQEEEKKEANELQYKKCPRCTTLIRNCPRYQKQLKNVTQKINKIKVQVRKEVEAIIMEHDTKQERQQLKRIGDEEKGQLKLAALFLLKRISQNLFGISEKEALTIFNSMKIIKQIYKLKKKNPTSFLEIQHYFEELISQLTNSKIHQDRFQTFIQMLQVARMYLGLKQKQSEGLFIDRDLILVKVTDRHFLIDDILFNNLKNNYQRLISERMEREMIIRAMGLARGHWYQCPNGHVYAIGECGGAMEEARCPECNARIGGSSHSLVSNNRLASNFDGASRPAYDPEDHENNLRAAMQLDRQLNG